MTAELVDVVTGHGWRAGVVMPAPGEAVAALRARGVDVEVVAAPRPLLHYGASTRGVRAVAAALALPVYWWRVAALLRRRADVVWVNDLRGLLLVGPAARLMRRPLVWHLHARPRQLARLTGIARRVADVVVVPSHATAALVSRRAASVVVLPAPVVIPQDPPPVSTRTGAATVVCVARIYPEKGVDLLVPAAVQLRSSGTDCRIVVVGAEQPGHEAYAARLRAQIHEHDLDDVVRLVGAVDDVAPLLASADVYVQPSRNETFGLAALEAMATGLPVVVTGVGGLGELVADGRTGIVVEPDSPEQLAQAIARLLSDRALADRLGQAARAEAAEHHSVRRFADTALGVVESLVVRA